MAVTSNQSESVARRILLGFGESLSAPEVCFSLFDRGYEIIAFTRDVSRCSLRHLPFVRLNEVPAPEVGVERTLEAVASLIDNEKISGMMPLDDFSLWLGAELQDRQVIGGQCKPIFAESAAVAIALNKADQIGAARLAGLAVPETVVVMNAADLSDWSGFPCVVKPARAAARVMGPSAKAPHLAKFGSATFLDQDGLSSWIEENVAHGPFLVQRLIEGTGEGVFGLAHNGRVQGWSAHRRVRMMNPIGSGSSACISRPQDVELNARIEIFLQDIGWTGLFMIEFLRDAAGTLWFMELNGRAWGSMALARRCGYDYPAWMIDGVFDAAIVQVPAEMSKPIGVRHLGRDLIHLLFVLRGPKNQAYRAQWPSPWVTAINVLRPNAPRGFYNYHRKFPAFFVQDAWMTVSNFLLRREP